MRHNFCFVFFLQQDTVYISAMSYCDGSIQFKNSTTGITNIRQNVHYNILGNEIHSNSTQIQVNLAT